MAMRENKIDNKALQNYLSFGNMPNKKELFSIVFSGLFFTFLGVSKNDNKPINIFVILICIIAMIIYFFKVKIRQPNKKQMSLYYGLYGLLFAFIFGILGVVQIENTMYSLWIIVFVTICDLLVVLFLEIYIRQIVSGKRNMSKTKSVSKGLIFVGSICGIMLSRVFYKNGIDMGLEFVFIPFSVVFSLFYSYIIKYRYYNQLGTQGDG